MTTCIRVLHRDRNGKVSDFGNDFDPEHFAGQVPTIGDMILNPGVPSGKDHHDPRNREIWTVVGRVFNPRDNKDYVSLIVESRDCTLDDEAFA
ncbi:MAG: hypothetical protein EOO77_02430 [Oxalobacteraceae bacterium]|nr:MAG: hypothetical protein EOO77_02430 [Oxalobacteraceae bacterium]